MPKIVCLDANSHLLSSYERFFERHRLDAGCFDLSDDALAALVQMSAVDIFMTAHHLRGALSGDKIIDKAKLLLPGLKCIMASADPPHNCHADVVLVKPFPMEELLTAIEKLRK